MVKEAVIETKCDLCGCDNPTQQAGNIYVKLVVLGEVGNGSYVYEDMCDNCGKSLINFLDENYPNRLGRKT